MQDLIDMTKAELAAIIGGMTASQIKKTSHADLVQMAGEKASPKEPTFGEVIASLTDLEKCVVVAYLSNGIEGNGAETLDAMRADNYTWGDTKEIASRTGLTQKQVQGVQASLSTKGLLDTDVEPVNGEGPVQQVLTDFGLVVGFELLADGVTDKAPKAEKPTKTAPAPSNVVELPTTRKPRTLDDRVIQKPADEFKHVRAVTEGSKRHILVKALEKGATMDELVAALGWSKDVVSSALRYDLGQMGLGCERKAGRYFLLLPTHLKRVAVKEKGQAAGEVLLAASKS